MITNYYTLRALVSEWKPRLQGATVADCYSQQKGSLKVVIQDQNSKFWTLNIGLQAPHRHIFMYSGSNRSRKNVVNVFERMVGQRIENIDLADRDRLISIQLASGSYLYVAVYGPKANVFFEEKELGGKEDFRVDPQRAVSAFLTSKNTSIPDVRPAPPLPDVGMVENALSKGGSIAKLLPLYPPDLIAEIWHKTAGQEDPQLLVRAINEVESLLARPEPVLYWDENRNPFFSTIRLQHRTEEPEICESFDAAVRLCARRRLAISRFSGLYDPLLRSIRAKYDQASKSLSRVKSAMAQPDRSEAHEKAGHLIMAQLAAYQPGREEIEVLDWMDDGQPIKIKMDARLTAVENASVYYEKAKSARTARKVAEERVSNLEKESAELLELLNQVENLQTEEEVLQFKDRHANLLAVLDGLPSGGDTIPYRRFYLSQGYEVWVGRNAKQNDDLTLKDARKFDLWLHARGVPGSHTILRLKGREDKPPASIIEQAASIAAWFSKAKTSSLAPVIYVERKYVRKPRKALPGAVVVEREKVIMVEPHIPTPS